MKDFCNVNLCIAIHRLFASLNTNVCRFRNPWHALIAGVYLSFGEFHINPARADTTKEEAEPGKYDKQNRSSVAKATSQGRSAELTTSVSGAREVEPLIDKSKPLGRLPEKTAGKNPRPLTREEFEQAFPRPGDPEIAAYHRLPARSPEAVRHLDALRRRAEAIVRGPQYPGTYSGGGKQPLNPRDLPGVVVDKMPLGPIRSPDAVALERAQASAVGQPAEKCCAPDPQRIAELETEAVTQTDSAGRELTLLTLAGHRVGQANWLAARDIYNGLRTSGNQQVRQAAERNLEVVNRNSEILAENDPGRKQQLKLDLADLHEVQGRHVAARRVLGEVLKETTDATMAESARTRWLRLEPTAAQPPAAVPAGKEVAK